MTKKKNDFIVVYDEHDPDNPDKARKPKPPATKVTPTGWIILSIALVFLSIGVAGIIAKTALSSVALPTLMPSSTPLVVTAAATRTNALTDPGIIATLPPTWTPTGAAPTEVLNSDVTSTPVSINNSGANAPTVGSNLVAYVYLATHTNDVSDDIFLLDMDTHAITNLTNDRLGSGFPAWSPDGSQIVYESSRDYTTFIKRQLYVINADGSSARQLTFNRAQAFDFPSWLPDGSRVLVTSMSPLQEDTDLYVVNLNSAEGVWLTDDKVMQGPAAWSPDGSRIVYSTHDSNFANSSLFVMNADGTGVTNISNRAGVDDSFPAWSPDSTKIAFVSSRDEPGNRDIYIMDADGGNVQRMTSSPSVDEYPSWSPDGGQIIFSSDGILTLVSTYTGTIISQDIPGTQPAWRPRPKT